MAIKPMNCRKGSPPHKPTDKTRAEVSALVSFGVTQDEIARYLDIDKTCLRRHYREEIDKAAIRANAQVARVLFEKATIERDTASVFFWLKTRARWREVHKHEVSGENGKPIEIDTKVKAVDELMSQRFKEFLNKDDSDGDRDKSK